MNMNRHLNHFKKPMLPSIFISIWPLFGLYLWLQMGSLFALIIGSLLGGLQYRQWRRYQRAQYIEQYAIPLYLVHDLRRDYQLDSAQLPIIERGFKDFCLIHLDKPNQLHNMPSKAVDALWHGFILDTRSYAAFCGRAFGKMLHHRPSVNMQALSSSSQLNALNATWRGACKLQHIRPQAAHTLPFLFMLDQSVTWPDGQYYALDQLNNLLRYGDYSGTGEDAEFSCVLDLSDCQSFGSDSSNDGSDGGSDCGGGCGD